MAETLAVPASSSVNKKELAKRVLVDVYVRVARGKGSLCSSCTLDVFVWGCVGRGRVGWDGEGRRGGMG